MSTHKEAQTTTAKVIDLRQSLSPSKPTRTWRGRVVSHIPTNKWFWIGCLGIAGILVASIVIFSIVRSNPNKAMFAKYQTQLTYRLYYPSNLPGDYFLDAGSISNSQEVLQFPIERDDSQSIEVAEEPSAKNFNLSQITGTRYKIPHLGTLVVGTGFLGYRAVIQTSSTIIILTCKATITQTDLTTIAKGFRAL